MSIQKASVGIVSKDGSYTTVQNSKIMETNIAGLMAYTKKTIYPAATLHAKDLTFKNSNPKALVQNGNKLILGRKLVEPSEFDIKKLYKTSMKPGLK